MQPKHQSTIFDAQLANKVQMWYFNWYGCKVIAFNLLCFILYNFFASIFIFASKVIALSTIVEGIVNFSILFPKVLRATTFIITIVQKAITKRGAKSK